MTKSVIVVLITLSVITSCTTGPSEPETLLPGIVIDDTSSGATALLAQQAYLHDNRLFIQFKSPTETVNSFAIMPFVYPARGSGSSPDLTLQQAVAQFNDLPLAQLSYRLQALPCGASFINDCLQASHRKNRARES